MTQVIDFLFDIWSGVWDLIMQYWLFAISFLIMVIGYVVDIVKQSKER